MKTKTQAKGVIMLLMTALIWGSSFLALSKGMEQLGAFTFSGIRMILGALVLTPAAILKSFTANRERIAEVGRNHRNGTKRIWLYGGSIGIILCIATNFQQYAFNYTISGKIAFLTALYMIFVPLLGLFAGKRLNSKIYLCALNCTPKNGHERESG